MNAYVPNVCLEARQPEEDIRSPSTRVIGRWVLGIEPTSS